MFVIALAVVSAAITPVLSLVEIAGALVGYALGRWWLVIVPAVVATGIGLFDYEPCPDEGGDCWNEFALLVWIVMGAAVALSVFAGVAARRRAERTRYAGG
jgi:hypothetical protein